MGLLDSLDGEWIKLPFAIMADVGPAVQTLGGLLKITIKETFVATADISTAARVPLGTARKHLVTLDARGWIENQGRQKTRSGRVRRTATLKISKQTRDKLEPYGILPWWACCQIRKVGKLPWSAKAVLSIVMARLCSLKAAVETGQGAGLDEDDLVGSIESMGSEDRFRFSLDHLAQHTGLTRESVVAAKRWLHKVGIIDWTEHKREDGGDDRDTVGPNWGFRAVETPAGNGLVYVDFRRG